MPATILPSTKHNAKATQKPNGHQNPRKTRVVRRRGRGRPDSDDELEREERSESGSDDENNSSSDSDSDNDAFSGSANHTKGAVVTPSTTQSPSPDDKPLSNGNVAADPDPATEPTAYKEGTNCWDAFDEEDPWGPAPAEVNFDNHDQLDQPSGETKPRRKNRNKKKKQQQASTDAHKDETAEAGPEPSSSGRATGPPSGGRSVRENYRNRLQDPSYVPTVGDFWGHDERLLDKDLRSLSGWWRGRSHRGRGGYYGRGRGRHGAGGFDWDQPQEADAHPSEQQTWGHDGFEEMKEKEEQRRLAREQRQKEQREASTARGTPFQRGPTRGGRVGLVGTRGRGFSRGGSGPSSPRTPHPVDRPWYTQKPERVWTKQLDGFLHFNSALKPRSGQGQGYRVKLAGSSKEKVVRVSARANPTQDDQSNPAAATADNATSPIVDNKTVIIRLPKSKEVEEEKEKEKSPEAPPVPIPDPAPVEPETVSPSLPTEPEESLDEVFTVKPRPVPTTTILNVVPPPTTEDPATSQLRSEIVERAVVKQSPSQSVDGGDIKGTPQSPAESQRPTPPILHPIRTVSSPVAPQPQTYSAPYQYPPQLPPGIAVNSHGITYEVATGRPVYLQPTPPPMYDPRPVMPPMHPGAVPFFPGHIHHLSSHSPDFTHSRSNSVSGYDPATGMALFSLPRQSSRVEIRRPDGSIPTSPPPTTQAHRPSGLRTAMSVRNSDSGFQGSSQGQQPEHPSDYYPSIADQHTGDGHTSPTPSIDPRSGSGIQHPGLNPNVMAYQPQPYPYYGYPDYGYQQYMDMSQMGYEIYTDAHHHNPQPGIFY